MTITTKKMMTHHLHNQQKTTPNAKTAHPFPEQQNIRWGMCLRQDHPPLEKKSSKTRYFCQNRQKLIVIEELFGVPE